MNRFVRNPRLERELATDPAFRAQIMAAGKAVQGVAERLSPRIMRRNPQAFRTVPTATGARVENTDYGAHLAEFGSRNNPPYAPLRRGVSAAGLRLEESSPE